MSVEHIIQRTVSALSSLPFVQAVVLGGSRATGTATENSDLDIGIYYDREINLTALNQAAARLDDQHRSDLVCGEGGWGPWVNCGGWLIMGGLPTDLILRDLRRVENVCTDCDKGIFSTNYHTGHPHAFLSVIYRGELARCKILFARDESFIQLKQIAQNYPEPLRQSLLSNFSFEAEFSRMLAQKASANNDLYYLHGHLFRSVSACNQLLFAYNRVYCLNEKKAPAQIETMPVHPNDYQQKVNRIFSSPPQLSVKLLGELCEEVIQIIQN